MSAREVSAAEVHDAERRADALARSGATAAEIDAADAETERLFQLARAREER